MKLMGFKLRKVEGELTGENNEGIKVNTKIDISDIKEAKSGLFKGKEQLLEIKFTYDLEYDPKYAKISLGGILLVSIDFKLSREILKEWKDKNMPSDFRVDLLNLIIRKCSVRALQLEEDLGLPYHMNFPSLRNVTQEEKAKEAQ